MLLTTRCRRWAALAGWASLAALAIADSATAGGSTGSLVVVIRPAAQHAPASASQPAYVPNSGRLPAAPAARAARRRATAATATRASAPGPTASLTLSIVPALIGLQVLGTGNWRGLLPIWNDAGGVYGVPWQVLAAINKVESNNGKNLGPSAAGAVGWMQFMPATWAYYGVDASGDGIADPNNPLDAITSAARYLAASGAGSNLARAIYAYNHAWWYVDEVLALAGSYGYRGAIRS